MKKLSYLLVLTSFFLSGCYYTQKITQPIETLVYPSESEKPRSQKQLLVLLPGIGDHAEKFEQERFVEIVQKHRPDVDVVAVNAHFKYYKARIFLDRMENEILKPAKDEGYCRVHIAGISLGGFGSLLVYRDLNEYIDQMTLLAPYLGEPEAFQYLLDGNDHPPEDLEDNVWPWIQVWAEAEKDQIYLGYGLQDKFAIQNELLSRKMDSNKVITIDGKHKWNTWTPLWEKLLQETSFLKEPERCTAD